MTDSSDNDEAHRQITQTEQAQAHERASGWPACSTCGW
jgi:hypothetical protein